MQQKLRAYVTRFQQQDEELYPQLIPNGEAEAFLQEQIPLLECPDPELEEMYYFRWWTFRKHIKATEKGYIITEYLPKVPWSGPYNSINCPACFHIREGRWLKDPQGIVKQYINFWLHGIGDAHRYSSWLPHAVMEYCALKDDRGFAVEKLPQLIAFFETREKKHKRSCGLYWSHDNLDGMEWSISGPGLRPTMNAYAYADAKAISFIAGLAQDKNTQDKYDRIARQLKQRMDNLLWDGDFYKTIPQQEDQDPGYTARPVMGAESVARELVGYIPWYFNMPDADKAQAFSELLKQEGFLAPYGLTTAEQRHPLFLEELDHNCLWNGPVWPFATSQTLVAAANLLRKEKQSVFTPADYYKLLLQYARSQHRTKDDGTVVPWIDENLHPYTGQWIARSRLQAQGWPQGNGGRERGKDYNHSLFCDLILDGLLGIRVENGSFTASPLIPASWGYFRVENLWLKDKRYRILYDKHGTRYGRGPGLFVEKLGI